MPTPELPSKVVLNLVVTREVEAKTLLSFLVDGVLAAPGFSAERWAPRRAPSAVGAGDGGAAAPSLEALLALPAEVLRDGVVVEGHSFEVVLQDVATLDDPDPTEADGADEGWWLSVRAFDLARGSEAAVRERASGMLELLRAGLRALPVRNAHLFRDSSTYLGPQPPHAPDVAVAYLADPALVERDYDDPDAYWASWDSVERRDDGTALVTRCLDLADEVAFKRRIVEHGLALARAARPDLTVFEPAVVTDGEQALLDSYPRHLTQVGYDEEEQHLELAASPPPGEHLSPGDIFDLLAYLYEGATDENGDELEVDVVIVTFPDRESARAEARVLWDVGVHVQHLEADGLCRPFEE